MNAWILTSEYNMYDQMGEYFICWFKDEPSLHDIKKALAKDEEVKYSEISDEYSRHVLSGGGRRNSENVWFNLEKVKSSN